MYIVGDFKFENFNFARDPILVITSEYYHNFGIDSDLPYVWLTNNTRFEFYSHNDHNMIEVYPGEITVLIKTIPYYVNNVSNFLHLIFDTCDTIVISSKFYQCTLAISNGKIAYRRDHNYTYDFIQPTINPLIAVHKYQSIYILRFLYQTCDYINDYDTLNDVRKACITSDVLLLRERLKKNKKLMDVFINFD